MGWSFYEEVKEEMASDNCESAVIVRLSQVSLHLVSEACHVHCVCGQALPSD